MSGVLCESHGMARAMGTSTQQTQRPLEEMCGDLVLAHSLDELAVVTEVRAESP